jgi:hypothetical protein
MRLSQTRKMHTIGSSWSSRLESGTCHHPRLVPEIPGAEEEVYMRLKDFAGKPDSAETFEDTAEVSPL